ncbi:hypothetical protein F511_10873 [Dorcoceras hygrometricum]|uniref:Uncharacterized protein n=1 Tax=Dorcoceras hygrometricum TaxID=472368 RepID=A0A2Z7BTH3_9LAMI|nr:hypothetical protein F511_10873 [Dorcoceras hygrometricum]
MSPSSVCTIRADEFWPWSETPRHVDRNKSDHEGTGGGWRHGDRRRREGGAAESSTRIRFKVSSKNWLNKPVDKNCVLDDGLEKEFEWNKNKQATQGLLTRRKEPSRLRTNQLGEKKTRSGNLVKLDAYERDG